MPMMRSQGARGRRVALVTAVAAPLLLRAPRVSAAPSELAPKRLKLVQPARSEGDARQARGESKVKGAPSNGITYHGGPILTDTTNVYVIWYGNWSTSTRTLLSTLLSN